MPLNEDLDETFTKIREYMDAMDSIREEILPMQRKVVRNCSEIIKKIHRKQFDGLDQKLEETKQGLDLMQNQISTAPGEFPTDYLQIAQQEFGEASIFYHIIVHDKCISPEEVGIGPLEYAYALADVVGELKRFVMSCLRENNLDSANKAFEAMNEMYDHLFTLDYPNGLVPGLRNKIDQLGGIVAKTEGDLVVSAKILRLNLNLETDRKSKKEFSDDAENQ